MMTQNIKILILLFCLMPAFAIAQQRLIIKGTIPLFRDGTEISLQQIFPKRLETSEKTFLTKIGKHSFEFVLNVDGLESYQLSANGYRSYAFVLGPGNANIAISDSIFRKVIITDNIAEMEYQNYDSNKTQEELEGQYRWARANYDNYIASKNIDSNVAKDKRNEFYRLKALADKNEIKHCLDWIKEYPNSYINTKILYNQLFNMPDADLKKLFLDLPARVKNNSWGKELKYAVNNLLVGAIAPDFALADTNGTQISLSKFKGRYVLIDFWASWCVPCRAESPSLVRIMQKYKKRNFTILSVSLDNEKKAWLKAINSDNLDWTHLSDLRGWKNPVSTNYFITLIPSNYLVAPNGKIIARNLGGDQLAAFLNTLNL